MQRIRSNVRRYPDGWGEAHPLTGLMYCADCGSKMYVHRVNNGKRVPQYTCSAYSKVPVGTLCQTQHRINADVVMELIKELLKAVAEYSQLNREEFLETVKKAQTLYPKAKVYVGMTGDSVNKHFKTVIQAYKDGTKEAGGTYITNSEMP